jgi:hypothetical protein
MKTSRRSQYRSGRWPALSGALLLAWALVGCMAAAPKPEQLQLPSEPPAMSKTAFSEALGRLGIQSEIYGSNLLKIQCREVNDDTGTSYHSEGEIPKKITVMVNSALNAIGGRVVYIPYWPDYFAGLQVSGYPARNQKLMPDVVLAGGITEFDRGLLTVDRTRDLGLETKKIDGAPDWFDNKTVGLDYSQGDKWSKAKIAVDFNLISFEAQCGIPKMQASNGITVYKGVKEGELGFTLFGPTIGLRGSVKKVQGRHDAVRFLVQFSVIQLVGRYLDLPYWKLLDNVQPDPVVVENLRASYVRRDRSGQTLWLKRLLWLHGHPVTVNDRLDAETKAALAKLDPTYGGRNEAVPVKTFLNLYLSVPVTSLSIERGKRFDRTLAQSQPVPEDKPSKERPTQGQSPKGEKQTIKKQDQPQKKDRSTPAKPKVTEPRNEPPKHEVIIITPLDAQTSHTLNRIVQRIESKHRNRIGDPSTAQPMMFYESRMMPVVP